MNKCRREAISGDFLPCHRAFGHVGSCAHEVPVMVYMVEELNQWDEHKILLVSSSLTAAQDLINERLYQYNRPYHPGYCEVGVDYAPLRRAEDWQYYQIYPEYWKNGKGHYLKLSTYKV